MGYNDPPARLPGRAPDRDKGRWVCPRCRNVEFFTEEESAHRVHCPVCGMRMRLDETWREA